MAELTVRLPESVTESEARLYLAIKLLELDRLSSGQAAELSGYSKQTFLELLGKHSIPVFGYPAQELTDDLSHA
jgi:predicted HTH domain antitoxin